MVSIHQLQLPTTVRFLELLLPPSSIASKYRRAAIKSIRLLTQLPELTVGIWAYMPLETRYSPLTFSPRPHTNGMSLNILDAYSGAAVNRSGFSYVVSSDGVEVDQPRTVRFEGLFTQTNLRSDIQDAVNEDVTVKTDNPNTMISYIQDDMGLTIKSNIPSLSQRRGKCPATLTVRLMDEVPWSTSKEHAPDDSPRNFTYPPIGDEYEVIRDIGNDSEGICTLVERRTDAELCVVKSVRYPVLVHGKPLEARILHDLLGQRHANIIHLHSFEFMEELELVQYHFEYCSGGDLHDLIVRYDEHNANFPEPFIWKVFSQLISALEYLHKGFEHGKNDGVVHRDVKPENIFVRSSHNGTEYPDVVLADFGLASLKFATHEPAGTFFWQPPEIPRKAPKGDVWAVGAVIHYMVHFTAPMLPLPRDIKPTDGNLERWWLRPDSRQPIRAIPEMYSRELITSMLVALEMNHNKRMNSNTLLTAIEDVMDQILPPSPDRFKKAEPLAMWAFDPVTPHLLPIVGDETSRGWSRNDGYRQYFEMMETCATEACKPITKGSSEKERSSLQGQKEFEPFF